MEISGNVIGTCVINDFLILFVKHNSTTDRIYKVKKPENNNSEVVMLFSGNLNFNVGYKIKTLPFYENENVQKVYWIDGRNQPRVINIAVEDVNIFNYTDTSFDFVQNLNLNETATIQKLYTTGYFKSGVIQYAATYFNKNGAESNIFWISNINYISPIDRAGKPDEIVRNSFKINIDNLEDKYDYVRLYSIYRTSIDTTPEVKIVLDIKIPDSKSITHVDSGSSGSMVDSDILLYVGGEELIPGCMSQKNNTLFLGNIKLVTGSETPISLNDIIPNYDNLFSWSDDLEILIEGTTDSQDYSYPYRPKSLSINDKIRHFKFDESYRLGIQGQYSNGRWSTPIWIGNDKVVDKRYKMRYESNTSLYIKKIKGVLPISNELFDEINLLDNKFIKIRPVMVPIDSYDRTVIAQGLVTNTLGIMSNRFNENIQSSLFAFPDYITRTNGKKSIINPTELARTFDGTYSHFELLKLNNWVNRYSDSVPNPYIEIMGNYDLWDYYNLYHNGYLIGTGTQSQTTPFDGDFDRDFFFVDKNIVNFWSPEITHNYEVVNQHLKSSTKACLYGFTFPSGAKYNYNIDLPNADNILDYDSNYISTNNYFNPAYGIEYDWVRRIYTSLNSGTGTHSVPFWSPEQVVYENQEPEDKIEFTRINKSGMVYFGLNATLRDPSDNISIVPYDYTYIINNPDVINSDSIISYKTNVVDNPSNSGLIKYSKNFEKIYPGGSYSNLYHNGISRKWLNMKGSMYLRYNTAAHAIFSFGYDAPAYRCMPRINNVGEVDGAGLDNDYNQLDNPWYRGIEGVDEAGFFVDIFDREYFLNNGSSIVGDQSKNSLPIFDIYSNVVNDPSNVDYNKYGGKSSNAIFNNTWIPCGKAIAFEPGVNVEFTDGDTYIQRFDLLKTFPNDLIQINQHTEIISFICESFLNLDGRSDVNRYNTDSSLMTPTNYGLLNNIYSQKNNYFTYNILDPDLFNTTKFSNTITWSKTKFSGEKTDTWTNINMLSSIDLDGVYGEISSINLFNNDLYTFQPDGIARLLFNERIQQQASDGVSVELTNGYKVPEYRYITNQYGSSNGWSVVEGKNGIYFVDYKNKSFNSLNSEGVKDLSLQGGFKSWFNNNVVGKNYTLSYDKANNDIYIHDETNCLNYSEVLNSFVSFYDYIDVLQMKNVWDKFISIKSNEDIIQGDKSNIWIHNSGEYNKFYDELKPFSIEYLFNPEPQSDKVFNTFEYRMDNQLIDWTDLSLNNWYQTADCNSAQYKNRMKRKFNVNRVQLPRQTNSTNRIRSTWMKMKLQHTPASINNNNKFEMQDLNITYTI